MLVLCNGMPRSASTWSYNVAMALLRRTAQEYMATTTRTCIASFVACRHPVCTQFSNVIRLTPLD